MAYTLEAVISPEAVLRPAVKNLANAVLVPLGPALSLLPVTSPMVAELGGRETDPMRGL